MPPMGQPPGGDREPVPDRHDSRPVGVAGRRGRRALGLTCQSCRHMGMPGLASASGFREHTDVLDGISRI